MNGIRTANESPNTASRTASAIGSAIASPFSRSSSKIGSRSRLDRRRAADEGLGAGRLPDGRTDLVRPLLRVGERERRADRAEDDACARRSGAAAPGRPRAASAPRASAACELRRVSASLESATRKTTRKEPSSRCPKRCSSVVRASSESVPGDVNSFERSLFRPELSTPPVTQDDRPDADDEPAVPEHEPRPALVEPLLERAHRPASRARRRAAFRRLTRRRSRTAANQT